MSDENLADIVGEFADDDGVMPKIDAARGTANAEEVMNNLFDEYKEKFPKTMSDLGNIKIDPETGEVKVKDSDGVERNLTKAQKELYDGKYADALNEMGVDTSTPEAKDFIKEQTDAYNNSDKGVAEKTINDQIDAGNKLGEGVKTPQNQAEMEKIVQDKGGNVDEAKKAFKDAQDEIKKTEPGPERDAKTKKFLDWCKEKGGKLWDLIKNNILTLALIGAIIFVVADMFEFIEKLQHTLSGCMLSSNSGTCKIDALTCSQSDIDNANSICPACAKTNCVSEWIPVKLSDYCPCNTPTPDTPFAGYNSTATTGTNTCAGGTNKANCPIEHYFVASKSPFSCEEKNLDKRDLEAPSPVACPYVSGCVARVEACDGNSGDCSKWCDSSLIMTAPGQSIKCKQCSFWCAAQAAFGDIFSWPNSLLGQIERIFLWICMAIIIIAIVYYVGKEVIHWLFSKKESDNKDIKVNITPIVKEAKAGFRRKK